MQERSSRRVLNPLSILGAAMAIFSAIIILTLTVLNATGLVSNPYTGILAFMVGPAVLVIGLLLIPIGIFLEGRRQPRERAFPVIDLNQSHQQRRVAFFAIATFLILILMGITTWEAASFMETTTFCGQVCHDVMQPEDMAHADSPHARVACVNCHIGPGAEWFVRSKISGLNQVVAVTLNNYERPIPTPLQNLRPARGTCEECHWPAQFTGTTVGLFYNFANDEKNTLTVQPMAFKVGGATFGRGIHWHTAAQVWYLPLDASRKQIGWVKVQNLDGTIEEYVLPAAKDQATPDRIQRDQRFMDCIDCHNRASHRYPPVNDLINTDLYLGTIDSSLPFIKDQAIKAIGDTSKPVSQQEYDAALARIAAIKDYYRTQQADVYAKAQAKVDAAVADIQQIYQRSVFPHMRVTPGTYIAFDNHDGCFRCHGQLAGSSANAQGKIVSADCQLCHQPAPANLAPVSPQGG